MRISIYILNQAESFVEQTYEKTILLFSTFSFTIISPQNHNKTIQSKNDTRIHNSKQWNAPNKPPIISVRSQNNMIYSQTLVIKS